MLTLACNFRVVNVLLITGFTLLHIVAGRAQPAGYIDTSFDPGTGANDHIFTDASLQPDGKIIICGAFTSYNGTARNRIARLNADGSLDTSFDPGTGASFDVYTTGLQPDGKIIISGFFTSYNGTARNRIARLNADGSLDTSFDPGTGANNFVRATSLQPDGKIIIGGGFTSYNGTARGGIARLNADGSLDTSFDPGTGVDNIVYTTSLQPDGKIIIGGIFTTYNGTARNNIARLNADGSLDTSFNPGTGVNNNQVSTISLQPDGKIIIGGNFTSYNGTARSGIARLNANGSLDTSFNPGTGTTTSEIRTTRLLPDGKIIIGGIFTSYNGTARNRIARLNADGSLDTSFDPGTGANNYVSTIIHQLDGNIIIGGSFTSYNGTARNRIARISMVEIPINTADSLALVALYESTNGVGWLNKTNWLTGPVYTWHGVTASGGRVVQLDLSNNQLNGTIPPELGNLTALTLLDLGTNSLMGVIPASLTQLSSLATLNLANNKITSLPDLTTIPSLSTLDVSSNNLDFASLESNASLIGSVIYVNQAPVGVPSYNEIPVNSDTTMVILVGGSANVYQWKYKGSSIEGATSDTYTINSINRGNMGNYQLEITNPQVPNLILISSNHRVLATATIAGTLLVAPGNPAAPGVMHLLRVNPTGAFDSTRVQPVSIDVSTKGTYSLTEVLLDDYVLNGFADTTVQEYTRLIPTWYTNSIYWEEADTIFLNDNILGLDIISEVKPDPPALGSGIIEGTFFADFPGGRGEVRGRVKNAAVTVRRVERAGRGKEHEILTLIAYVFTNEDGEFSISKLETGQLTVGVEYRLNIQYPGYPMDTTSFVTILLKDNLFERQVGVEAEVIGNKIVVRKLIITGWEEEDHSLNAYPNPTADYLFITEKSENQSATKFQLIYASGKVLNIPVQWDKDHQRWELRVHDLKPGIFILRVQRNGKTETLRIIIQ